MPGTLDDMVKDMAKSRAELEALAKATPRIIGIEAVRVVKENFIKQGYDSGAGFTAWEKRKPSTNKQYSRNRGPGKSSVYKGSVFSAAKPILRQTNNLFDSIRYRVSSGSVFIGTNLTLVPYAKVHNEGLPGKIPKRQYMPLPNEKGNPKIMKAAKTVIDFKTDQIMKKYKK